ncbi:hypothetical protein REJC140_01416 [Pseudorhizobium endolithicum]|uniref:Uncharacterized protein n=1 Tax=Pseudorhizobium endolithicum TaxID=1191678 RepID=A0ABM8PU96_9HYPH|nr:hypothetical protein [Pseudorhizobium endolithicum]CAD7048725.1 hypothetical protein REJC140_01416 [Pseudorhizobium endolithicum]
MNSKLPPIPEENRSDKGPGEGAAAALSQEKAADPATKNYAKQGQQGNSKINTTNQGYQQDR